MAFGFHVVGLKSDENRDKHRYKDDQRSKMNASLLFDVQKKVAEKEMNYINAYLMAEHTCLIISSTQMHCIAVRFLETHGDNHPKVAVPKASLQLGELPRGILIVDLGIQIQQGIGI